MEHGQCGLLYVHSVVYVGWEGTKGRQSRRTLGRHFQRVMTLFALHRVDIVLNACLLASTAGWGYLPIAAIHEVCHFCHWRRPTFIQDNVTGM